MKVVGIHNLQKLDKKIFWGRIEEGCKNSIMIIAGHFQPSFFLLGRIGLGPRGKICTARLGLSVRISPRYTFINLSVQAWAIYQNQKNL